MKSILTVLGAFLFSVFVEGFTRVIIIFYHQLEFSFFGISTLPNTTWGIIFLGSVLVINWISGMLTISVMHSSPKPHILALGILIILFRTNEFFMTRNSEPLWYLISLFLISLLGIALAYLTYSRTNDLKTSS